MRVCECAEVLADAHSFYSDLIFFRCCLAIRCCGCLFCVSVRIVFVNWHIYTHTSFCLCLSEAMGKLTLLLFLLHSSFGVLFFFLLFFFTPLSSSVDFRVHEMISYNKQKPSSFYEKHRIFCLLQLVFILFLLPCIAMYIYTY